MAEDLTDYLESYNIRVQYMHHETDTIKRMEILKDFRCNKFDVLVGINLLREGLDIPEVTLVAILDADKQGFLRSETSLIQTIGRTARNSKGKVIMYADSVTSAMESAILETERRRNIQMEYNSQHGITPKTIVKSIREVPEITKPMDSPTDLPSNENVEMLIAQLELEMHQAQEILDFEHAIFCRDKIRKLKEDNLRD
jgi:excinuclease ABC subunit B